MCIRMNILLPILFLCFYMVPQNVRSAEPEQVFKDNQKAPVSSHITGGKGEEIKGCIDVLFKLSYFIYGRRKAEDDLIELLANYSHKEIASYNAGATWSSPLNFESAPNRKLILGFLHMGTGHYVSFWVLHELPDGVMCYKFKGSEKGCGHWQVLHDLDADNYPEIIIKHFVGQYEGAGTMVVWPAIYKWDGKNYIRADEQFPDYYSKNVVPEYQRLLAQFKTWSSQRREKDEKTIRIMKNCEYFLEKALSISGKR